MVSADGWLGDVCVLGLGKTGVEVARYLSDLPEGRLSSVTLYGGASSTEGDVTRELAEKGVRVVVGTESVEGHFDLVVASPGIPERSDFFRSAQAHATEVIGEPEFAWRESPERWAAITGSNGKTTTTSLACAILNEAGISAAPVGNIGNTCTTAVADRAEGQWFVAELSSFQLACSKRLHPHVACLLNVTPDHLEWHGSFEAYAEAKERIFANLEADDLAIVSDLDGRCRDLAPRLEARGLRVLRVGLREAPSAAPRAWVDGDTLTVELDGQRHGLVSVGELSIHGDHNVENALFASALAIALGADDDAVRRALRAFSALEHRIEPVCCAGGVRFVNDSKATNTDSVEKALTAFEPHRIVVMLGGHDKGTDLTSLSAAVVATCKAAVCFGEAGERIAASLEAASQGSALRVMRAGHLADALDVAVASAEAGDTVLLSPACSSFDEFNNMAERGRRFKELVYALREREGE